MIIERSITEPIRHEISQCERWQAADKGLIACWENGRQQTLAYPAIAALARAGELPSLDWKGGVSGPLKSGKKIGTHFYYATWLGLRGENLRIDTETTYIVCCSRFGVTVTFTGQLEDYANA